MDDASIYKRKPNVATDKEVLFSLRNTPLLEQGTTYDPLASAENLWVNLKVYGRTEVLGKYEGVMLPKNAKYKFEADEAENLVMLRVGGGVRTETGLDNLTSFGTPKDVVAKTSFADGYVKVGNAPKNGESSKNRVYAQDKFFAAD
jgi:hypothetical protein